MPGTCPRCEKTVYFNEEKMAIGKSFHKSCFSCANKSCNRKLDSGNLTTHDNDLYCKVCYGRLFGPKGYGHGAATVFLTMDSNTNGNGNGNGNGLTKDKGSSSCDDNPQVEPHVKPELKPQTNGGSNVTNGNGNGLTKNNRSSPLPTVKKVNMTFDNFGNRIDICPRCNKQVYLAEKMMGGGKAWHKMSCFNCAECHKRLESTTLCEKEGEIYCKTCYAKQWGPSGYGHGINPGVRKVD
ncbi:cysteine and glycine-rich protein 1-like [Panonychus citri]|uniref:cysteine and glycine-rich protein 1-like n=1 Tax=Panonychus citri TaxID=50023 RepID=UPI0023079798|nr:cysteine and glycine-rich protein 1-like [Panonychus citri]XP_053201031.1 cysteine and glycine-rich protein 1-like [Panonychus citri]XP_053201032.1 cysteine and glycine-rich protein 1-like [Panonychus citri]